MRLMFSAINCVLDSSNGAAISIRTFLRLLSQYGVECRSFTASIYDRPAAGSALDNIEATGARSVEEPGLPQTLWLGMDGDVRHYIEHTKGMRQSELSKEGQQRLFNRALAMLDAYKPDVLLLYGNREYERSMLMQARKRGIKTVFYLVNAGYKDITNFKHVDLIFTDTHATRELFVDRFNFNPRVIGKFIDKPVIPANARAAEYVTFINPAPIKGVTLFLRIVELAAQIVPSMKFLVVENRSSLSDAEARTGISMNRYRNVKRIGLQRDMGTVYAATRVLLAPSLWHDSGPRVSVEALSLGIPSVVSNRGGLPELVGDAGIVIDPPEPLVKDHWLVPPISDAIPWVEALRSLLEDDEAYESCRAAALAQWARHDPALRLPGIVAALEELVAQPPAPAQ